MEQEKLINLIKNESELVENSKLQTGNILVCINTKDPEIKLDKLIHPSLMNKNDIKFGVNKGATLGNTKLIVCDIEELDQINDQDIRWHEQQDGDEPLNVLQDWQKDDKHFVMVDDQKNAQLFIQFLT